MALAVDRLLIHAGPRDAVLQKLGSQMALYVFLHDGPHGELGHGILDERVNGPATAAARLNLPPPYALAMGWPAFGMPPGPWTRSPGASPATQSQNPPRKSYRRPRSSDPSALTAPYPRTPTGRLLVLQ